MKLISAHNIIFLVMRSCLRVCCSTTAQRWFRPHLKKVCTVSSIWMASRYNSSPNVPGPGLKGVIESIDNRGDFKVFMQNYAYAHGGQMRGPRREGPQDEGFVSCPPLAMWLLR